MRYHYDKPEEYTTMYGSTYICSHPVYDQCTLFQIGNLGLAVIQQRYDKQHKSTYWTSIDPWLVDALYLRPGFQSYFRQRADICQNGFYPTVTVRQIMWALRMKPLPKERWETCFDRREI